MVKYFKIGEMAALNHVSTQTLRLYAKNKLLEPEYQDEQTGYRYYTLEQCAKLDLIRALKSCCLSLEEIKRIFSICSTEELTKILKMHRKKLDKEIYDLTVSRNNLIQVQKNLSILKVIPPFGEPYFVYKEERLIDVRIHESSFRIEDSMGYTHMIRDMQDYLFEKKIAPSYFINIGTIVNKEDFDVENYITNRAFVIVDELYPERKNLCILPEGMYLAIVSDDTRLEMKLAQRLHEEVLRRGMVTSGDYVCEVLAQSPFNEKHRAIYKIQVPVEKKLENDIL